MASTRKVRAGGAFIELTTRDRKLVRGLQRAQKRLTRFAVGLQTVGTRLAGLGVTAAAPIVASLTVFTRFDDAMRGVKAITQSTESEFEMLRDRAKELGRTTSFSASEVALLMTELGRAGFKPDEIDAMTASVMNLARATGTEAAQASGIFAATIRQFGLGATDASRVADGLTAAANKSFNSVESLGQALQYAGPVAADANMSLEDTLAILGTLGNLGIQGSSAGNALKRLLTLSAAESQKFQKVFGVSTKDAKGDARSLVDVLGEVAQSTAGLGSADRAAKFNEVFGMLGITSASAIGKNVADTRKLLTEIQGAQGTAAKTAKEMDSGIGGAFRILKSSLEGVAIAIGEAIEGPVTSAARVITDLLATLSNWVAENKRTVLAIVGVIAGVTVLGGVLIGTGLALKAVAIAIGGLSMALAVAGSVLAMMLSPLGLLAVGLVGLGMYFGYAQQAGAIAMDWLSKKFAQLKDDALKSFGAISNALASGNIAAAGKVLWSLLKMEWTKGIGSLTQVWLEFKYAFAQIASDAAFGAAKMFTDAAAGIEVGWVESLAFLADAWSLFTNSLTQVWYSTIGFIKKAWVRLKSLFDEDINVDAEVNRINAETQANKDAAQQGMLQVIGDRDKQRQERRQEIENDRLGANDAIENMQQAEQQQRDDKFARDLVANQKDVDDARAAWKQAIAAANKPAEAKDGEGKDPAGVTPPNLKNIRDQLLASQGAIAREQKNVEVKGGFNAMGLSGIGADSLSQRSMKATEQVAENTRVLVDKAKEGRLVFA